MRFDAVAEALAAGGDATASCAVAGEDVARDGASLGEALFALRSTCRLVTGRDPDFAQAEALAIAWSEATLAYLHDLSCEDPLTGLASLAHLRTRIDEIYRDADFTGVSARESHALVVVDVRYPIPTGGPEHHFTRALRLVRVGQTIRAVYSGGHVVARLGQDRAAVVAARTPMLGGSVALLRRELDRLDLGTAVVRAWIEGLPGSAESAARLVDELAR
jgi:GGDEF domain-containing protein